MYRGPTEVPGDAGASGGNCRLLTLNIGGPSLARAQRLADYLSEQDLDVIVLTETRANAGTGSLVEALRASGYEASWPAPPTSGERGVALLRRRSDRCGKRGVSLEVNHRLVVDPLTFTSPLNVIAAYVPSRDASPMKIARKQRFLTQLLDLLGESAYFERTVIMGDLNIVSRDHRPRYSAFRAWEYEALDRITQLGYVDVHSFLHPGVQAHSWIGRTGDGYRYDYVFVSPDLADATSGCEYLHDVREARLSDHAGVLVTLAITARDGDNALRPLSAAR